MERNFTAREVVSKDDTSYSYDYFGLAGNRGVWRGLESVAAARGEAGVVSLHDASHSNTPAAGCPPLKSLTREGVQEVVCNPIKATRGDLHR